MPPIRSRAAFAASKNSERNFSLGGATFGRRPQAPQVIGAQLHRCARRDQKTSQHVFPAKRDDPVGEHRPLNASIAVGAAQLELELSRRARSRGEALFVENELVDAIAGARCLTGVALRPRRVRLAHADPGTARELARWFDCTVEHGAARTQLVLAREDAQLPSRFADAAGAASLERSLRRARADVLGPFSRRVRELLARAEAVPTAEEAARQLGSSQRSLFRRLADEGASLQALVDDVRAERACALLAGSTALADISDALGFSEPSAFFRAFRRWTGLGLATVRAAGDRPAPNPARFSVAPVGR